MAHTSNTPTELNARQRKQVRVVLLSLVAATLTFGLLVVVVCATQRLRNPAIWNLLLVIPGAVGVGGLLGFLFATVGQEEKRFADWFKAVNAILGGAALTDLAQGSDSKLRGLVLSIANMCRGEGAAQGADDHVVSVGMVAILILGFLALGFLLMYFSKAIYLNPALKASGLFDDPRDEAALAEQGTGGKSPAVASALRSFAAMGDAVDPEDPQSGRWGGKAEANERRLSATVEALDGVDLFRVTLQVASTSRAKPLAGSVRFHLHPTFKDPDPLVQVQSGVADLVLFAWGAFTVGAEADDGQTQLELDLATVDGAPRAFRIR